MLQPLESWRQSSAKRKRRHMTRNICWHSIPTTIFLVIGCFTALPRGLTQLNDDLYIVKPTPALRLGKEDLTTVLLVKNEFDSHGRFKNVRPEVGLLTSTARTFIQEGVTTEYATQVVGTTLDNGRVYAQYLKKSSRVLYDGGVVPSVVTSWVGVSSLKSDGLLPQSHNDLFDADQPDWQAIDDRLLPHHHDFVGNTDYVALRESNALHVVSSLASKSEDFSKTLSWSSSSSTSTSNDKPLHLVGRFGVPEENARKVAANKVLPIGDLPTYTIKQHYEPSAYFQSQAGVEYGTDDSGEAFARNPKLICKQLMLSNAKSENEANVAKQKALIPATRHLDTVTYYGFADFTTIVGDSVIVFSPSTASANTNAKAHVTSIKGEATLGAGKLQGPSVLTVPTTITHSLIEPSLTEQIAMISSTLVEATRLTETGIVTEFPTETNIEFLNNNTVESSKEAKPVGDVTYLETSEIVVSDITSSEKSSTQTSSVNVIKSSLMLSRPSDEEILRIYNALANAEADKNKIELTTFTTNVSTTLEQMVETSNVKILGGATTIFFEDDPFANFVDPAKTSISLTTISTVLKTSNTQDKTTTMVPIINEKLSSNTGGNDFTTELPFTTEMPIDVYEDTLTKDREASPLDTTTFNTNTTTDSKTDPSVESIVIREIDPNDKSLDVNCIRTSQVFLTQIAKTLTQLATVVVTNPLNTELKTEIKQEIQPTFDIEQATKYYCIQASKTKMMQPEQLETTVSTEREVSSATENSETQIKSTTVKIDNQEVYVEETENPLLETTENSMEIKTEQPDSSADGQVDEANEKEEEEGEKGEINKDEGNETEVEEKENDNTEELEDEEIFENSDDEDDEEIELIYKTLYTTYTYLTTFFHDESTSVSSHTEVVTHVVTSTLGITPTTSQPSATHQLIANSNENEINPTVIVSSHMESTNRYMVPTGVETLIRSEEEEVKHDKEEQFTLKSSLQVVSESLATFYTTYTYYTTIFAEGETEIMSHTEVITNLKKSTPTNVQIVPTTSVSIVKDIIMSSIEESLTSKTTNETSVSNDLENVFIEPSHAFDYSTITRATSIMENKSAGQRPNIPDLGGLSAITLVTDVRSSSSTGNQHIINSFNLKKPNDLKSINDPMQQSILEDQISSESNTDTDEIIPSATLLLQTSFTTFTYYTTMYSGDKTNVISRLETMTNTVTETLQASKTFNLEEASIPITYFTTFTYWTKLAKEGQITTLSREETISNIVTPTMVLSDKQEKMATKDKITAIESSIINEDVTMSSSIGQIEETAIVESIDNIQESNKSIMSSQLGDALFSTSVLEPTTYYTTYTYYTTSYDTDNTITDSRYETVTNIVTPTITLTNTMKILEGIATSLPPLPSTPSQYRNSTLEDFEKPNLILYDFKKIIDADGISTLYFTTHIKSSVNAEGLATEIISSTSSLYINEEKKTLLTSAPSATSVGPDGQVQKQYKTGLVRLIEGTRVGNHTTTLYQSKVIGTVIDQRYAQIIESTSSFIFEKTQTQQGDINVNTIISPTSATDIENMQTTQQETLLSNSNLPSIEGSIRDQQDHETSTEADDGGTNEDEETSKTDEKLRFPFQTKKRPYIPPFRTFPNRSRPQFAPKKNSSATIITRSDFTPTITATPALKTSSRFSSTRRGGSIVSNSGNPPALASSSRRSFGRPSKSYSNTGSPVSSSIGGLSSLSRNRFGSSSSSTARPSFASSTRRLGSAVTLRPSFSRPALFSTGYSGNSRLSIKPAASLDIGGEFSSSSVEYSTTSPPNSQEEDDDSISQDEQNEEENATESTRRQNNPLLRLKRPLNRPQGFTPARPATQSSSLNNAAAVSPRRNLLTGKAKSSGTVTTTTTTTTTQKPRPRTFQRPVIAINNAQSRARPINSLFPPRNIFGAQKAALTTESTSYKDIVQSEQDANENDNDDDSEYDDDDDEESEVEEDDENNRRRRSNGKHSNSSTIVLDIVKAKSRNKREAESTSNQNRANFRNRFRRPKLISSSHVSESKNNDEEIAAIESSEATPVALQTTPSHRTRSRFGARYAATTTTTATTTAAVTANNHRAIRPTRTTNNSGARAQFTLREKDSPSTTTTTQKGLTAAKRPSFRRPQPAGGPSTRRFPISTASSSTTSAGKRRLKSFSNSNDASISSYSRNAVTSRNRPSTTSGRSRLGSPKDSGVRGRGRNSHDFNSDPFIADNGGSITVTHMIPAEVTIPVVNGKVTEYKQVVTAKTSTQVVGPQQYTTTIGSNGQSQLVLTKEDTSVNYNGATEVTQYVLHETPTTTITFTPTTIRGRKTSFSHVLPSTVYSVEQVVSTQQPQISPNAPLANILLSQLLLGNVGLPTNPLFGAIGGALSQPGSTAVGPPQPATPVTEYKTHAFTYITTLFEGQSTILPITFQGKKILTTIFDTTAQTITATEFITDTIVTTPTMQVLQAQPVVNSLLLQQLLLQQHLQQQQQIQQQPDPTNPLNAILNSVPPQLLLGGDSLQELDVSNNIRGSGHGDLINEDDDLSPRNPQDLEEISTLKQQAQTYKSGRKKSRKNGKNHKRKSHNVESVPAENSVITLYVSGRRPGEFSTVLSTVNVRPDSTLYKRQVHTIDSYSQHCNSEGSENINDYVAVPEIILLHDNLNITESENVDIHVDEAATQSLESIVGDVTQWYKTHITTQQTLIMSKTPTGQIDVTNSNDVILRSKAKKNNSSNTNAKHKEIERSILVKQKNDDSNIHPNHHHPLDYSSDEGYLNYLNKYNFFA